MSTSTDDADPFAKASVQIVHTSISSGSVYSLPSAHSKSWSPTKVRSFLSFILRIRTHIFCRCLVNRGNTDRPHLPHANCPPSVRSPPSPIPIPRSSSNRCLHQRTTATPHQSLSLHHLNQSHPSPSSISGDKQWTAAAFIADSQESESERGITCKRYLRA